jgi:hypothetical protein
LLLSLICMGGGEKNNEGNRKQGGNSSIVFALKG